MAWTILIIAGIMEVAWAIGMKYTQGFTRLIPSILTVIAVILSMGLLGLAVRTLPLGTAYAVWTGIGTIGTVLLGILLFHEHASPLRLLCVVLILSGIIGLRLLSPS